MITQEDIKTYHEGIPNQYSSDEAIGPIWDVRSLFISDIHMGSDMCNAPAVVGLLNHIKKPEFIYVLGDGFDGWSLGLRGLETLIPMLHRRRLSRIKHPQAQADIIQKLFRHARAGSYLFFQGGNHDPMLKPYVQRFKEWSRSSVKNFFEFKEAGAQVTLPESGIERDFEAMLSLGRIYFVDHLTHKTADGRYFLTMHGDEFDGIIKNRQWIGIFGTKLRDQIFAVSEWLSRHDQFWVVRKVSRNILGLNDHFSLADYLHNHQSGADAKLPLAATEYIKAKNEATDRKRLDADWSHQPPFDGVLLGHNHRPALQEIDGIVYGNCGDWLNPEHNTAIVEHHDGRLELVRWDPKKGIVPYIQTDAIRPDAFVHSHNPVQVPEAA